MKNIKTYTFRNQTTEHEYNFLTVHASTITIHMQQKYEEIFLKTKMCHFLLEFKYHARLLFWPRSTRQCQKIPMNPMWQTL
jgi:hypothetical protein